MVFDLGEPGFAGLCGDHRRALRPAARRSASRGSDDAAQMIHPIYWDLPLYPHDDVGKVLRWYLGTPTFGTAEPRRYWR